MSILATFKTLLSSFTVKLFVWFWLIAIISVVSTRFISQQLANETLKQVVSQTASHNELRQLHNAVKRIERSNITNLDQLLKIKPKRLTQLPFNLWFKSIDQQEKTFSLLPLRPKRQQALTNYIKKQTFTQPKAYVFSHTRLIGPLSVTINKHPYQLFISRKQHKRNFGQIVQGFPSWLRFAIPTMVSLIVCLLLARSFSKPVRLIKKAAIRLGRGDFTTRVVGIAQNSDELGQLALSFNKMAEQLQQNQSAQQRLLGDISHELRSPMTRLQMALGLAQQGSTTSDARAQYLQRCQLEIERLDKMIADVLTLSRLENTLQKIDCQQVNLNALIINIIKDEQFVANEKSIKIQTEFDDEISLQADQILLASAIGNVLSNAVKYSPEQSIITVNLTTDKDEVTLIISDSGNGVPEQALTHLFTPFYRVNLARDRNTGGTGLGLAIAKQAIMAHQGKIFAKNKVSKGLSVTIHIPYL